MEAGDHWRDVYRAKRPDEVSWFELGAATSLSALARAGATREMSLVDVGGGASMLVDGLLERGWRDISVVDFAEEALTVSKARLGEKASTVHWEVADIRNWRPGRAFDVWHDRAVFHFLTEEEDRAGYKRALLEGTHAGSLAIIATFALDGPKKCSGLPVRGYDAAGLGAELGAEFVPAADWRKTHVTPWGAEQHFQWCIFIRR